MNFSIFTPATPHRTDSPLQQKHPPKAFPKGPPPSTVASTIPSFTMNTPNTKSLNNSIRLQKGKVSFELPSGVPLLSKSISCNQLERKTVLKGNKEN